MTIRILICDDHRLIQRGLETLLHAEAGLEIVGIAASAAEAIQQVQSLQPDLALMDISMPDGDGITLTRELKKLLPALYILILTAHEDDSILRAALKAGASGYVVKRAAESELIDAIRAVVRGEIYIHSTMTRALLRGLTAQSEPDGMVVEALTPREVEVLRLLARGYTNRQIAEKLVLSVRTVESHRANITGKLGIKSRVDLADYAESHHLLDQ